MLLNSSSHNGLPRRAQLPPRILFDVTVEFGVMSFAAELPEVLDSLRPKFGGKSGALVLTPPTPGSPGCLLSRSPAHISICYQRRDADRQGVRY